MSQAESRAHVTIRPRNNGACTVLKISSSLAALVDVAKEHCAVNLSRDRQLACPQDELYNIELLAVIGTHLWDAGRRLHDGIAISSKLLPMPLDCESHGCNQPSPQLIRNATTRDQVRLKIS